MACFAVVVVKCFAGLPHYCLDRQHCDKLSALTNIVFSDGEKITIWMFSATLHSHPPKDVGVKFWLKQKEASAEPSADCNVKLRRRSNIV
jgi:hypothetical protein